MNYIDILIALALSNNPDIHCANLAVEQAHEQQHEAFTHYFPSLRANAATLALSDYLIDQSVLGMPLQYIKSGTLADLVATQPLFAGGQIVNSNKLAKIGVEVAERQRALAHSEIRHTVTTLYWQIVMLQEKEQSLATAQQLIDQLVSDMQTAVDAGVRHPNDLLEAQLRQHELHAQQLTLSNTLATAHALLNQHVGSTVSYPLPNSNAYNDANDNNALSTDEPSAGQRTALLHLQLQSQTLQRKITTGKALPTLAISAALTTHTLTDQRKNNRALLATLSIPLSDWWGNHHATRRARLSEQIAEQELTTAQQLIAIEVDKAQRAINEAYTKQLIAEEAYTLASDNLHHAQQRHAAGTITTADLLRAQQLQQQTAEQLATARANYHIAQADYHYATR